MTDIEKQQAASQYQGWLMALDLLKSRRHIPEYRSGFQSLTDIYGNRAMEYRLETLTARGEVEAEFTALFPYTMEFPEHMKSNPKLNLAAAVPSTCWDAMTLMDWNEALVSCMQSLSPRYPHINDIPFILEQEIAKMTQTLKN